MAEILTGNTPEKWEQIKTHPFYESDREWLLAEGERCLTTKPSVLLWSDYSRFMRDGDRKCYENGYFDRRQRVAYLTILTKLYGEKYLDALCDVLWLIMDESTWVVPAHMANGLGSKEIRSKHLDLFSTETGALLAETYHILGDVLPKQISDRLVDMVKERVIEPFFRNIYGWMEGDNNWASVCASQIALCVMYLGSYSDFMRIEPEINRIMNLFLASYGDDGCCLEGLEYWSYGFGTFLNYADAVKNYSQDKRCTGRFEGRLPTEKREEAHNISTGVIDYFVREDVKRASQFAINNMLSGNYAVSFSDTGSEYKYPRACFYIINREYPGLISYPDLSLSTISMSAGSHNVIRHFLWSDPDAKYGADMMYGTSYYKDGQWFIRKNEKYSIAAKGGHNNEPHNHNDVGTFIITTPDGMALCDTGKGEYTRQYFDNKYRYDYLVTSSRGHSLPIINGNYQSAFTPKASVSAVTDDLFEISFKDSYKDPSLEKLSRRFECCENKVTVTDTFEFSQKPSSLTERFVTFVEPAFKDGRVKLGEIAEIGFDNELFEVSISSEEYKKSLGADGRLFFVDLERKDPAENEKLLFEICINE